jgi:glycerol-3-phosphate acyltransferase PlsX
VFEFVMKMVGHELAKTLQNERQLALQAIQNLVNRYDYHEHGGAPLLGIDGICIICHGSSGDRAIKNALGVAARYATSRLNDAIVRELEAGVKVKEAIVGARNRE